jgi:hypothetical protein
MIAPLWTRFVLSIAVIIAASWMAGHLDEDSIIQADSQATVTITQPDGVDDVVGEGDDYATTVFGDAWDMSESSDILALHIVNGGAINNGLLRYRVPAGDTATYVPVLYPGIGQAEDVGRIGVNFPIDTQRYRWLSFRMYQPAGQYQIRWHFAKDFQQWSSTNLYPVTQGWHTYVIDLETAPIGVTFGGNKGWEGQVVGLDLVSFAAGGTEILLDWVRLTAVNPTPNGLQVAWSSLRPSGSDVEFWLDTDQGGCDGTLIQTVNNAAANGAFTWNKASDGEASPANVEPGQYYVCARTGEGVAGYSSGQLEVNAAPVVRFTQPSYTSGDDYATAAGNPWDFDSAADLLGVDNGSYAIQNGVLAVTVPSGARDVRVWMNVPTPIARHKYHYLTYRLWFDFPYTLQDVGQVTRIFWGRAPNTETTSNFIYDYPGWQTYNLDLRTLRLNNGLPWLTDDWTIFRIDPIANLTGQTVTFYLDYLMLTSDETADTYAEIKWALTEPDSKDVMMDLYYDTDNKGFNGTPMAQLEVRGQEMSSAPLPSTSGARSERGVAQAADANVFVPVAFGGFHAPCQGACYTWDTRNLAPGAYYVYGCTDDGHNRLCRYSERPLVVDHD